jgi:hypothetical protein
MNPIFLKDFDIFPLTLILYISSDQSVFSIPWICLISEIISTKYSLYHTNSATISEFLHV